MEYYSAIKEKETITWTDLINIMLSYRSQKQNSTYYNIPFT